MNVPGWSPLGAPRSVKCWLLAFAVVMGGLVEIRASYDGIESNTAYACENGQLLLECQHGEVIRIIRANYGRFTISVCNRHGQTEGWNLQCMSLKSKDIISERCDGRRTCQMHVNNHVFGDPCPSTSKYAEVKYNCQMAPTDTSQSQITPKPEIPYQLPPQTPLNGSPRPPHITTVTALSPNEIEIGWTQPQPSSPILTTVVYFTDQGMDVGPSAIYTNSENSLVIEQLRPNTTYEIFMKSFNIHGPSVSSNTVSVTTLPLATAGASKSAVLSTSTSTDSLSKSSPVMVSTETSIPSQSNKLTLNTPTTSEALMPTKLTNFMGTDSPDIFTTTTTIPYITTTTTSPTTATSTTTTTISGISAYPSIMIEGSQLEDQAQLSAYIRVASSSRDHIADNQSGNWNKVNSLHESKESFKDSVLNNPYLYESPKSNDEKLEYKTGTTVNHISDEEATSYSFDVDNIDQKGSSLPDPNMETPRQIILAKSPTLEVESREDIKMELGKSSQEDLVDNISQDNSLPVGGVPSKTDLAREKHYLTTAWGFQELSSCATSGKRITFKRLKPTASVKFTSETYTAREHSEVLSVREPSAQPVLQRLDTMPYRGTTESSQRWENLTPEDLIPEESSASSLPNIAKITLILSKPDMHPQNTKISEETSSTTKMQMTEFENAFSEPGQVYEHQKQQLLEKNQASSSWRHVTSRTTMEMMEDKSTGSSTPDQRLYDHKIKQPVKGKQTPYDMTHYGSAALTSSAPSTVEKEPSTLPDLYQTKGVSELQFPSSMTTYPPSDFTAIPTTPSRSLPVLAAVIGIHERQMETTTLGPPTERPWVPPQTTRRPETRRPIPSSTSPPNIATTTTTITAAPAPPSTTSRPGKTPTEEHPPNNHGEPDSRNPNVYPEGGNGVVDKFCEQAVHKGVLWPQTRYGRIAEERCPQDLRGTATWRCLAYGWEKAGPDLSECISAWLESIDVQINNVLRGEEPADVAAVDLSEAMKGKELTSGDLKRAAMKLLPKLAQGIQRDDPNEPKPAKRRRMKKFKQAFLKSGSNLLSKENFKSWRNLSRQDRRRAATSLVLAVEDTGFESARLMDVGESETSIDENIVMEVNVVDTQIMHTDMTFPSKSHLSKTPWEAETDTITITSTSLKVAGKNGPLNIVFTLYRNMEDLIQPQWNTITSVPSPSTPGEMEAHYNAGTIRDGNTVEGPGSGAVMVVNTKIIAASMDSPKSRRQLAEPVRFTLHHLQPTNEAVPVCSFWDMDTSSLSGQWSQDGCEVLDTNNTHTTCQCNHLTNFAVLMDVSGTKLSSSNELALRVITFVGCVISIICLILSWVTFLTFKNLQCDRNTIHKNLVLCLLLAEIVFLSGISQTEPKILCAIIAGLLHYLFLGAFAWMCLEGVQLYVMLVEVFEQEKSRVLWYYLFGYGAPAVVVAISAGIYHQGYGTARHCWLTTENGFIWSFIGPALGVMAINIVMLSIAIYTMCRHSNMSATMRERSKVTKFSVTESLSSMETFASPKLRFPDLPAWVKGAIVLVVLLGLTWLLGVLYLNEESVVMAYFFTVLNSLQGLFIFIFHCLKNEKVQKEYRKVARRTSWLPNCIRVNYGGYTGVASSSPVGSSGSGNYLSKLFGQRRRKRSASSTNSSAKPFLNKDQYRRSDTTEHSSSKESSQIPSSLNGYVYTPGYTNAGNNVKTPFLHSNGNGVVVAADKEPAELIPHYETVDGMAEDLSEYIDCSVVDSEFVSEYCKHNLQVSNEERRYSTGSEDSDIVKPVVTRNNLDVDNLSTLSLASSSRKVASDVSSMELLDRAAIDADLDDNLQRENPDSKLNLQQYIIPSYKKNNNNNNLNVKNINEHTPKKLKGADNKCSSMNKLSKPVHSLSSIPEAETSPQHSSTPNIQFKLGFTEPSPQSSTANSPESNASAQDIPVPIYEEVKLDMDNPSSGKASLPNLNMNGLTVDCGEDPDQGSFKRRHSSENDVQFSPFRFSSTEC